MILYSIPVLVMGGISLYVGIGNFFIWFQLREKLERLFFFGVCTSMALYDIFTTLLYNSQYFETSIWLQRGQFCALSFTAAWMLLFVERVFLQRFTPIFWFLFACYSLFGAFAWIDSPLFLHLSARSPKSFFIGPMLVRYTELHPGPMFTVFYTFILAGIAFSYAYFWKGYRKRKDRTFPFVQAGLTVFFCTVVNDTLITEGILKSIYLMEYSFLAVILTMDYVMQRDFVILFNREKAYAAELEQKVKERTVELEATLASVKTLSGLIPICASCKKIRDDKGYWQQVEEYVSAHSTADFSHGICPDCMKKMYPEQYEKYLLLRQVGKRAQPASNKKQV
jgi:hypothetical protein